MIGRVVVLFTLCAVSFAIPIDENRTDVADSLPGGSALEAIDPKTTLTDVIPIGASGDESSDANENNRDLSRPKRFLLLKKLALAKAGILGLGWVGIGLY